MDETQADVWLAKTAMQLEDFDGELGEPAAAAPEEPLGAIAEVLADVAEVAAVVVLVEDAGGVVAAAPEVPAGSEEDPVERVVDAGFVGEVEPVEDVVGVPESPVGLVTAPLEPAGAALVEEVAAAEDESLAEVESVDLSPPIPSSEAIGLTFPLEVRPHPRFERPLQASVRSAPLLTNPPWVRSLGRLAMEVTTQGWR